MEREHLVEMVQTYGGLKNEQQRAELVIDATIETLFAALDKQGRKALEDNIGTVKKLSTKKCNADLATITPQQLYQEVAGREKVDIGFAMEHAQAACSALAEIMEPSALKTIKTHGAETIAELLIPRREFRPSRSPVSARHHSNPEGRGRTLAADRPGSRHPVSEAEHAVAHTQSMSRKENPRRDTKISSSTGSAAERHHRTLAEGRPGSRRPLSETED